MAKLSGEYRELALALLVCVCDDVQRRDAQRVGHERALMQLEAWLTGEDGAFWLAVLGVEAEECDAVAQGMMAMVRDGRSLRKALPHPPVLVGVA